MTSVLRRIAFAAVVLAVGACASARSEQWAALAALKAERVALDAAAAGYFVERSRTVLAASHTLGEYLASMDPVHRWQERAVVLARSIDQAAHFAALRLAAGLEGDQLAEVRRLVCSLGVLVRGAGVAVFVEGNGTQRCAP